MTLEGLGIPTVLIATPKFENSARLHAKVFGLPEYECVMLNLDTSSIAGASPELIESFAEGLFDDVVRVLTGKRNGG